MSEDPKEKDGPNSNGPMSDSGSRALRRGGARREVTDKVLLVGRGDDRNFEGWSLNMSRGGLRIVTEGSVTLGEEFEVCIGEETRRAGRVVWLRQERDGIICGIEFLPTSSGLHSIPPAPPGSLRMEHVPESPEE